MTSNGFFKVKGCVCKDINIGDFKVSHLNADYLTIQDKQDIDRCKKEAEKGNISALLSYAYFFRKNKSVDVAIELFKRAASLGSCQAVLELEDYYIYDSQKVNSSSLIVIKNMDIVSYLVEAVDNNMCKTPEFLYLLGFCYESLKRPRDAFISYQKSAKLGFLGGMGMLGNCYMDGIGTGRDLEQAYYWYNKASNLGCPTSCEEMGIRDLKSSYAWFNKEAEFDGDYYRGLEKLVEEINNLLPDNSERVYLDSR